MSVDSLPQPGAVGADGNELVIEFANVLNLPSRAKVEFDGTVVGFVSRVDLKPDRVDVTATIDPGVAVPSDTHATMQQSTVLGDTYLSLERQSASDEALAVANGGRIPLVQTTSPPQLEDTLANLANFVGSGAIQRAQNSIIRVNNVTPANREDLRSLVNRVTVDLTDLSNEIDVVDTWLQGVSGTADTMVQNLSTYQYWFTPDGMLGFERSMFAGSYIGTILPSVGSIYSGGYWLTPLLNSMADTLGAVQQSKWNVEAETPLWHELFTEKFLPVDKNPAINITSIKGPDGREMVNNVQDVLRMLGATP
ncbi:mammalian cell entry protein [Mycolicibacterium fortuitum]|uniref:Mammalian cell entry protein n=1 Tax=Mycolicibacterium fortuitum TaxID=1766 RepID=A0ABD6QDQ9_MYCFO|nr:mammalian cell entry protein [Mycolicibacterium fortuitum]